MKPNLITQIELRIAELELSISESQDELNILREMKNVYDTKQVKSGPVTPESEQELSAVYCGHANENPNACDCPKNCYCRTRTCKDKPLESLMTELAKAWSKKIPNANVQRLAPVMNRCMGHTRIC